VGTILFSCERELSAIRDHLNSVGPWTWTLRDSDEHGAYLLARPDNSYTKVRLIGEAPPDYQLVTTYDPRGIETPVPLERIHDMILDRLLPAIGARNVRPGPPWDW
jgi:hypothetical protein